jgi:hypothetical protein
MARKLAQVASKRHHGSTTDANSHIVARESRIGAYAEPES